jgi:hypothetical protein
MKAKHTHRWTALPLLALAVLGPAMAQTAAPAEAAAKAAADAKAQKETEEQTKADAAAAAAASNFFNGWAVGLAVIKPKTPSIADATIVDGLVRVNNAAKQEASLLVSRHFYPFSNNRKCGVIDSESTLEILAKRASRCLGLMVGVGLGTAGGSGGGQLINFAGMGVTIGGGVSTPNTANWQFGFGIGRKFNAKVLGDGFKEGAAPPGTETQVRYKSIDTEAQFIYFSTSW